jgi:hypothetical protein
MDEVHFLMLEETRESFFQFENLISFLDMKAFGVAAIDTIFLSAIVDLLSNWKSGVPVYYYTPSIFLILSLGFIVFCIWLRTWERQSGKNTICNYGTLEPKDAAGQLAVNYASCEEQLRTIYDEKMRFLKVALAMTGIAFIQMVIIFSLLFSY